MLQVHTAHTTSSIVLNAASILNIMIIFVIGTIIINCLTTDS